MQDAVTSLALCWRIERRDGVTIGLTDHDRDLMVAGLAHRAAPGMTPSAIERSDGLEPDTMDVAGALTSAAIGARDLLAGRWDGARVAIFAVDWLAGGAPVPLGEGTIGAIETRDDGFVAELAGPTARLAAPVVEETSAECRAELGDRRCRVALRGRRRVLRVTECDDVTVTLDAGEPSPGAYGQGLLRWLSGPNCGLASTIAGSAGAGVTLRAPPAFAVAAGTLVAGRGGLRQDAGDVRRAVRQRGEFSRRAVFAGDRSAHPISGGLGRSIFSPGGPAKRDLPALRWSRT